jgi:hypothetical protein
LICNISKNFEDINDPPHEYFKIVPKVEIKDLEYLPKFKIKIADGIPSMDSMKVDLANCKFDTAKKSTKNVNFQIFQSQGKHFW